MTNSSDSVVSVQIVERVVADRVAVIGGGLMGSSVLRAFKAYGCARSLSVYDRNPRTADRLRALELEAHVEPTVVDAVRGADIVVLAIPLGEYPATVQAIAKAVAPGCIVTDVGSVKAPVVEVFSSMLPPSVCYIPAHPVAGLEKSGPDAGSQTMFDGRWLVVTPPADCPHAAIERLSTLWRQVGAQVAVMSPEEHDTVMAVTSHLPHLLSFCMMVTAAGFENRSGRNYMQYSAGGFRDFTRIAASDPVMWRDILLENGDNILSALDDFTQSLKQLSDSVRHRDSSSLLSFLQRSNSAHSSTFGLKTT
ncbi:prephenate dehydrogenase [Aureimonas altamirensis]|uniref:prephenate dehydrogenase n=1 Tax=Aureimonas altamirensis TaxID=370622 RepID=UPI002557BF90|nr:prephenate dehydrogenase/arogenate dehydrogenase family protein [Aureimonas altamirensis]